MGPRASAVCNALQIGVEVPPNTAPGTATVIVSANGTAAAGLFTIASAAPGLFADGSGRLPRSTATEARLRPQIQPIARGDCALRKRARAADDNANVGIGAGSGSLCVDSATVTIGGANAVVDIVVWRPDSWAYPNQFYGPCRAFGGDAPWS